MKNVFTQRLLIALCTAAAPGIAHANENTELMFMDELRLSRVYHVGLPCQEPSDTEYNFIVKTDAPQAFSESYVHGVLRYTISEMEFWAVPNNCLRTRGTDASATFVYEGEPFATAHFNYEGMFLEDLTVNRMASPIPSEFDLRLFEAVTQGTGNFYRKQYYDDVFDANSIIGALKALLPDAEADRQAQIYYMISKAIGMRDGIAIQGIKEDGGDVGAYIESVSSADGEREEIAWLREAAEMGHAGAALRLYKETEFGNYLHPYKSSSSKMRLDDEAIKGLYRRYGFIFDLAEDRNIGGLLSEMNILAQKGYSLGADGVFNDPDLPPSAQAIEAELNAEHGRMVAGADRAISDLYSLPPGSLYDCDGTWCNIAGGFGGRARINVVGQPDCEPPAGGRTTCRFSMSLNFDSGMSQMPYGADPVVAFMDGLIESSGSPELPEVEALMVREGGKWKMDDLEK